MTEADRSITPDFLRGGGELGALIRATDWTATPLGAPEGWPQSLKTAIRIMLTSRQPIWIGWGRDLLYFYNDAYKSIIGGKHPWALGKPTSIVWREIWDDIGPMLAQAMRGDEGTYVEEQLLIMERSGYPEETYYTFSYSPIPDDDGTGAGGIICANAEDTARVIGERQLASLRELAARTVDARSWREVCERTADALCSNPYDLPFAALYIAEGRTGLFSLAGSCGIAVDHPAIPAELGAGPSPWPLGAALDGPEPILVADLATRFAVEMPRGAWDQPASAAALLPVPAAGENGRAGVLIVGLNPFRLFDEGYAGFLTLAAGQIAAAIANAEAYEQERARAEALAEIDRAKTAFFSNVSHEFRTPLTLMLGPLEEVLAKDDGGVIADNRQLVEVAHRNGLRLMKLVNALLDFSRIEAGRVQARYQPTDLAAFTADLASSFRSATERAGLHLNVDAEPLSEPAYVDRDMWEKIVFNLLSNAFKFTLEGGIQVSVSQIGEAARLTVRDTGIGIAEPDLPRLFERFQRVEGAKGRSFEGSGIGLALVQELARLHGGDVSVESVVGEGSTFHVTIPLGRTHLPPDHVADSGGDAATLFRADAFVEEALRWLPADQQPASEADLSASSLAEDGRRPRVVLADDNADMRGYVQRLLAERYDVEAVADGEAALTAIRRERPDLLLTDVMMPRLDGFGLLRHIREDADLADLPVIMLSARAGEEAQVEGLDAGADDYLIKPFSARELTARVSATLELARSRSIAADALRQLNERLADETDRLNRMFQQAPTFMAMLRGPDHVFELVNPAYEQLIGHRDVIGKPVAEALPEIATQGFIDLLDTVYRSGEAYVGESVRALLDQTPGAPPVERHLNFVYQPITDADGTVRGIFVQGSDITLRKQAEAMRLAQSRVLELALQDLPLTALLEQLVSTIESVGAADMIGSVLLLDAESHCLRHGAAPRLPAAYNAAVDGIRVGPAVGSCGAAASRREPVYASDIATDPLWADYRDLALSHGLRACWSLPILTGTGKVLGTFAMYYPEPRAPSEQDLELVEIVTRTAALIIERKQGEEALRASEEQLRHMNETLEQRVAERTAALDATQEQLRQSQKLEAMGQLTGGVAHDFNNLLTPIVGSLDMLQRAGFGGAREQRMIDGALQSAERARTLVQRLLAFARRQPLQPSAVDVASLIEGMAELVASTSGPQVKVVVDIADALPPAQADQNQLEMAILNLSVNARDAMPDGGTITIAAAAETAQAGHRAGLVPGDYVRLSVADTGTGMDEETVARAIEPFFSTKGVGKGTGLGLSMVHGLASQLGGGLAITSRVGLGSRIELWLPVSDTANLAATPAADTGPVDPPREAIGTALLVDDEDLVRASTADMLHDLGYDVVEARSAEDAWHRLAEGLAPDFIVTDHLMPGMTGVDLANRVRADRLGIPVLVVSGYADSEALAPDLPRLTKPFRLAELSRALGEIGRG